MSELPPKPFPKPKPLLRPPVPRDLGSRTVNVPPTVGSRDTTTAAEVPTKKLRVDLKPDEFTRVILQHGKHVLWRKAMLCPCKSEETEQARLGCAFCGGGGYLFVDPLHIQALMFMFDKRTSIYEKFGLYQQGSVQVTVQPKHRLGYRDSIEMLDAVIPMNELIKRGDRRGLRSKLPDDVDTCRFRIVSVAKMLYLCANSGKLIELRNGTDFKITSEGWIRWLAAGDRLVPKDGLLTVHYDFHPIYLVASWMHVTRDDLVGRKSEVPKATALPVQAMAQLMWLTDVNVTPSMDPFVPRPSGFGPEVPP